MMTMKSVVVFACLCCIAWGYPEIEDELYFRRVYVDPENNILADLIPRITQGHEAPPHSIPYQAYLIIRGSGTAQWLCGGSLISRKFVLTAGHCLSGGLTATVYLGAHNISRLEDTQLRIISQKLTEHERYNLTGIRYDIGVIELPEEVELNEYVDVVRLPTRADALLTYEGANARVSGWGLVSGDGATSKVLLEVNSTIITNALCNYYFGIVQDYQVCISGYGGVGSCNGDSGGPLIVGNEQVGIVSYGVKNCLSGYPSAFTKSNSFLDWLEEHTDLTFS